MNSQEETSSTWQADPRLVAYMFAGLAALVAAVVVGRYQLAALGTPFAALAGLGLLNRGDPRPHAEVHLDSERMIEDDIIEGEVRLTWEGEAEADVLLTGWRGVEPIQPSPVIGWSLPLQSSPVTLNFQMCATAWGRQPLGDLWIRLRRRDGLLVWEQKLASAPSVRILPSPLRLNDLLGIAEPHTVAGAHLSRMRGGGTDLAELRPYLAGDRMRDLSWSASARLGEPWVVTHHPERTGTVVLLLDAFAAKSNSETQTIALARAARAAWAVASVHLRAQDRVGLQAEGRATAWLYPQSGRRGRWQLLDELLSVGTTAAEDRWATRRRLVRPATIPNDALIVGVTTMDSWRFRQQLLHYRRAGHTTVALVIDTSDMLPAADDIVEQAAQRLWLADREAIRHSLERSGIPTALFGDARAVGPAIMALRRRSRELHRVGAMAR